MELFPSVICVFHNDDIENLEVSQRTFKLKATLCLFTETKTFCLSFLNISQSYRQTHTNKQNQNTADHSRGAEAGSVSPACRRRGSWKRTGLWRILIRFPSNPNVMRKGTSHLLPEWLVILLVGSTLEVQTRFFSPFTVGE